MIIIISGPSGVGKGTIIPKVIEATGLKFSRSWTTRARRPGDGEDDYLYVSRERFEHYRDQGGFLESAEYEDNYYGTPVPEGDILLEIDVQGVRQVKQRFPDTRVIYVLPPGIDDKERLRHLARRQTERDGQPDPKRLLIAVGELAEGPGLANLVVVNDDLDKAVVEVVGFINSEMAPAK